MPEPRGLYYGAPGHCFSIDGDLWHNEGSCRHADGRPCCGYGDPEPRPAPPPVPVVDDPLEQAVLNAGAKLRAASTALDNAIGDADVSGYTRARDAQDEATAELYEARAAAAS